MLCILYSIISLLMNKPRTTQSMKKILQTTILNMKVLQTHLLTLRSPSSADFEDDNISEEQKHSTFAAMMNKFHEIIGGRKEKLIKDVHLEHKVFMEQIKATHGAARAFCPTRQQ